ncbi:carbohydrate sulfotransferase 9-like [Penaeus japonicus]|uniref:carbohydrate sulfotransferase 9-like n=1 Tax=Penaeus japonicus TaxID=27405 RepID=UPI001C711741|nr:carbohydrate sulfotransferase 9-like [Penaeus japonicus]
MIGRRVPRLFKLTAGVGGILALFLFVMDRNLDTRLGPLIYYKSIIIRQQTSASPEPYSSTTTLSSDEVNDDNGAQRFIDRKEVQTRMCQELNLGGKIKTKEFMYYNRRHKLLVCAPPKTGCSSIKRHLLQLAEIKGKFQVHSRKARKAIAAKQVLGKYLNKVLKSPSPATRVMVARHPLDRLVSGYREKFKNGAPVSGMWGNYLKKYRKSRGFDIRNRTLPFPDFLEMIAYKMETKGRNSLDRHFRPTSLLCSPCSVQYDYIFHTDTLTEDLKYIVDEYNITGINIYARMNSKVKKSKGLTYEDYYKDVPLSLISRIYALFKEDFLVYGFKLLPSMLSVLQNATETS